jgi:hypothetical protein
LRERESIQKNNKIYMKKHRLARIYNFKRWIDQREIF